MYSGNQTFIRCLVCKYFLLFCGLSLYFRNGVLCTKTFNLVKSSLSAWVFWLLLFVLSVSYLRSHCLIQGREDLNLCFLLRVL